MFVCVHMYLITLSIPNIVLVIYLYLFPGVFDLIVNVWLWKFGTKANNGNTHLDDDVRSTTLH